MTQGGAIWAAPHGQGFNLGAVGGRPGWRFAPSGVRVAPQLGVCPRRVGSKRRYRFDGVVPNLHPRTTCFKGVKPARVGVQVFRAGLFRRCGAALSGPWFRRP